MAVRPQAQRGRGRHFLRSSKLAAELVRAAEIGGGDLVLDVGAGSGMLTAALARAGARVLAVEVDARLSADLRRLLDPRVPLVRADVIVEWGFAAKRAAVWPSTQLGTLWSASWELSVMRRLPRTAFAPPPSVDAAFLRIVRRERPLVDGRELRAYAAFLARGYRDGPRAVVPWARLKRLEAELGFDRHARPRDLDAHQWAALYAHAVRRTL